LADSTTADPFAMWRDWVSQSERQWNSFLNNAMSTDEFSQSLGKFMDVYLGMQKNMNDVMSRYLTSMNVPTRDDVLGLGDRLSGIEERLMSIEHAVAGLGTPKRAPAVPAATNNAVPRPPRTRKPAAKH
jgi:polyhydroxyalkanoic acid synthase PhaR subunit